MKPQRTSIGEAIRRAMLVAPLCFEVACCISPVDEATTSASGATASSMTSGTSGSTGSGTSGTSGTSGGQPPSCQSTTGAGESCGTREPISGPIATLSDGGLDCALLCPNTPLSLPCSLQCLSDGGEELDCPQGCLGRIPTSLRAARRSRARHPVGALFAESARLEAASVEAFAILEGELRAHRAPEALQRWSRRASAEEVVHARLTSTLAKRYGARPLRARVAPAPKPRTLEEVAVENAIEGCARETYGALVARWQAAHAADPHIRAVMGRIAADELSHAELGWAIARWAEPKLSRAARATVNDARRQALAQLATHDHLPAVVTRLAGLPPPAAARALVAQLSLALES